jgi:transcriptional regulator with XRE-family HTH domain
MTINHISLGQRIRLMRKRKGLTQLHLSELVGLSPTYISYIESGYKSMSLATFIEIANALNVTADELLIDSLENTVKVSNHELAALLSDCSEYEKKILLDVASATKKSLRENRSQFHSLR